MPNSSRRRNSGRPQRRSVRAPARRFTRRPAGPPGGDFFRTQVSQQFSEPSTFGVVTATECVFGATDTEIVKFFSQLRINRVGVRILPQSNAEFIVRGYKIAGLDTRQELLRQRDLKSVYINNGKAKTYWFKPNQAVPKFWIDITAPTTERYTSGLWLHFTGTNSLDPSRSGLLLQLVFDVTLQGPINKIN